jgi:hypothetical protein
MSGNVREDGMITAAGRGQTCLPTAEKNAQLKKIKVRDNGTLFLELSCVCAHSLSVHVPH